MTFNLRTRLAKRELQRMVDRERKSLALKQWRQRRAAALKGLAHKRERVGG